MNELLVSPLSWPSLGWFIALLVFAIALASSLAKATNRPMIQRRWSGQLGMPDGLRVWAAGFELASAVAFLFSYTMVAGAVGLTAYLGGALALHARVNIKSVCVYALVLIAVVWLSVQLRR